MFLQHIFRTGKDCMTGAMLLLVLSPAGLCQTASDAETNPAPSEAIDEITVYGAKSLLQLRHDVYRAEEDVYAVFNSLNSDDEFDIHCYYEVPVGSHIRRRNCRANYVDMATAEEGSSIMLGVGYVRAAVKIQHKTKLLQEELKALVVQRPEFNKALDELSAAKQVLESERQRKCEGQIIFCRK